MSDKVDTIIDKKAFEQLEALIKSLSDADVKLLKLIEDAQGFSKMKVTPSPDSPAKFSKAVGESSKFLTEAAAAAKASAAANNGLTAAQAKLAQSAKNVSVELEKAKTEARQQVAINKQLAKISSSLSTVYEKESAKLSVLTRRFKEVALTEGLASKNAKKLSSEMNALDSKLRRVDEAAGQFQKNVGNYPRSFKGALSSVKNLTAAAGLLGGAFLAVKVATNTTRTILEFDKGLIAVSKTTDLSGEKLKDYSRQVVKMGSDLDGISTKELLQVSEIAGTLGIKDSKNILKFAKTLSQLKKTSDLYSEESQRDFAKFINIGSDDFENADRLGSVITKLGNDFATTEKEILKNAVEVQKGISIYNTSAEGVLAIGAATSALGNQAESTRSAIQSSFFVINSAITGGGKPLEKLLELTGLTRDELVDTFEKDGVKAFNLFVKGLSEAGERGGDLAEILTDLDLKEKTSITVIGSLAKNYDQLSGAIDAASAEYVTNSATSSESIKSSESLASRIGDMADNWDNLVLSMENGDGVLARVFKEFADGINIVLKGLALLARSDEENQKNLFDTKELNSYNAGIQEIIRDSRERNVTEKESAKELRKSIQQRLFDLREEEKQLKANKEALGGKSSRRSDSSSRRVELLENKKALELNSSARALYEGQLRAANSVLKKTEKANKEETEVLEKNTESVSKNKKERKDLSTALNGSVDFYKNLISKYEKERDSLADNSSKYNSYTEKIKSAQDAIDLLIDSKKELGDTPDYDGEGLSIDDDTEKSINGYEARAEEISEIKKHNDEKLELDKEYSKKKKDLEEDIAYAIVDFTNVLFDAKIQRIEDEITSNNEKYAALIDNENLTEQEKNDLETERESKEKEINKRKKEELKKQAIFNKALAVAEIGNNIAVAFTSALKISPIIAGLTAALGAVRLAAVIARPIPEYKTGKKSGEGVDGVAWLGDGYRTEVIEGADGNVRYTPSTPTLMNIKKTDTIHKSVSDYSQSMPQQVMHDHILRSSMIYSAATEKDQSAALEVLLRDIPSRVEKGVANAVRRMNKNVSVTVNEPINFNSKYPNN